MICRRRINFVINYQNYINIACNKHFHLSPFNRVRKPSSARRASNSSYEDVQEHTASGVYHDPLNNMNVYKNFYGVEGDEGVINVDELGQSEKSIQDLRKMSLQQPMNEFRSFNFGAIRLDNENKPSYYAPRRSVKLNENDKIKIQRKNIEHSNDHSTVENLKNDNLNIDQNKLFAKSVYEPDSLPSEENGFPSFDRFQENISKNNKRIQNVSLTDISSPSETNVHDMKKYIADSHKSNKFQPETSHVTESYEQNQFSSDETPRVSESFIDECYFTENYSEDFVSHIGKSPDNVVKEQNFADKNTKLSEKLPKTSIHDLQKDIPNSFAADNFQSENSFVIDTCKQNQLDSPKVSESFIDKYYLADAYAENTVSETDKHSDNFIEKQYFNESNLNTPEFDYKTILDNQTNDNHFLSINEDEPNVDSEKITFDTHKKEKQSCDDQNDDIFNPNINMQNLAEKNVDLKLSEIKTVPYEKYELKKDLQEKFDKNKYSSNKISTRKTDLTGASKKGPRVLSQTKNHDKEVNAELILDSVEKSNDKESLAENKIETAFDFVKKIKRNKLLSDDIKKGISAKKEKKVDSKGFRILKHQVPSLEYFTRDEMLELLKESILYSDEDIVVLNKPYNLVIHESSSSKDFACLSRYLDDLAKLLDQNGNSPQLITVHRLDKETTGCLLLARNELSATRLKSLFAQRKIVKTYWIVTIRVPDPMDGIIDIPVSEGKIEKKSRMVLHPNLPDEIPYVSHSKAGKQAITQYSVIAVSGNAALVEVRPETGIKHQIRVHFGFGLGCPILGDHKYSHLDKLVPQKLASDLLQRLQVRQSKVRHIPLHIHSKHIFIPQYANERNLFVTAPLPKHMSENLRFLKFKKK